MLLKISIKVADSFVVLDLLGEVVSDVGRVFIHRLTFSKQLVHVSIRVFAANNSLLDHQFVVVEVFTSEQRLPHIFNKLCLNDSKDCEP